MIKQKIYIAGKITGLEKEVYTKAFEDAEKLIKSMGHEPINPIKIVPETIPYDDQMHLCFALVDISDAVMMLDNWVDSPGATNELIHGAQQEKKILYYDEQMELYENLINKHNYDAADATRYFHESRLKYKELGESLCDEFLFNAEINNKVFIKMMDQDYKFSDIQTPSKPPTIRLTIIKPMNDLSDELGRISNEIRTQRYRDIVKNL